MDSTLLLLADGRLPTGSHVHSGGVEAAVADGRIGDLAGLHGYLVGRLWTVGRVDAAFAWAGCARVISWSELDAEAAARCPSPALRAASRAQGRGMVRVGRRTWAADHLDELEASFDQGPMWSVALGAVAAAAGVDPGDGALVAAHASVVGPAWAGVRLLGLDPFSTTRVMAQLSGAVDAVARETRELFDTATTPDRFPASGGPLSDIAAEAHGHWEVRLFAS
jgi:urease accessory protein